MSTQIDQSVKIEQLNRNTIIGLANDIEFSVVLPSKVKSKLQTDFRRLKKPKLFRVRTFTAAVVLLLHHARFKHMPAITLDREYAGQEPNIRSMFSEMCQRLGMRVPPFEIQEIGKRSNAHDVAFWTMKGKRKANKVLTYNEVRKLALN